MDYRRNAGLHERCFGPEAASLNLAATDRYRDLDRARTFGQRHLRECEQLEGLYGAS